MFLSKASVVLLVAFFGTPWFTGDGGVSASPLGQVPVVELPDGFANNPHQEQFFPYQQQFRPQQQQFHPQQQQFYPQQRLVAHPQQIVAYPQVPQQVYLQPANPNALPTKLRLTESILIEEISQ
ncbi:uncharacterized protein LOC118278769 [Spodoptera frugiperda]|uniref:Uncharacterized protein LOC118278769 n=1 Tax=Spodoptera frugiperda TaxID=7108 RepID=A0A9R0E6Z6_SPOFR|nr:uncharacterized protein LOC118278769 [Spodoptera frugiperda]